MTEELMEGTHGTLALNVYPGHLDAAKDTSLADLEKQLTREQQLRQVWSPLRELVFIALVCSSQFITQAAFGQIIFTANTIGEGLGTTSAGQTSWIVAGFSLTVGTFVLPAGRLGDIYGSKLMVVTGWAWFGLFSILAGLSVFASKGQGAVIMFCLFQGLRGMGPAFLLPNSLAILGKTYEAGVKKNMVFSMFAMSAPTGALTGGAFGALFSQLAWWPWSLWSIGIAAICLSAAAYIVLPPDEKDDRPREQHFDMIGAALGVSGMILFNFAWNQAPVVTWSDPYIPTLLAVALLVLMVFILYERKVDQPILPPDVFNAGSTIILVIVGLGWATFGVFTFYTIQFLQVVRHHSPLNTIAQLSPIAVSGVVAAVSTGFLISRIPAPLMTTISAAAFVTGTILVATMPAHQVYWAQTFIAIIVMPFGMDISFPAASLILSDMVPKHLQGVAASLVNTVINYSISIGLGVAGTAEYKVRQEGASVLHGYRVALFVGVGMSGAALTIALCFALYHQFAQPTKSDKRSKEAIIPKMDDEAVGENSRA